MIAGRSGQILFDRCRRVVTLTRVIPPTACLLATAMLVRRGKEIAAVSARAAGPVAPASVPAREMRIADTAATPMAPPISRVVSSP